MRTPSRVTQPLFLVDCNNFFVSCEQVFDPRLRNRPVVVLSNNDGCIISRSKQAKALGIGMGEPLFRCAQIIKAHDVQVRSSNFALYADMSGRIMHTLARAAVDCEVYSIDEAFLHGPSGDPATFARSLRKQVLQYTGIPVSIGIGATKTLAKIANKHAKKNPSLGGVYDSTQHPALAQLLATVPVNEVWGVGRKYARMLTNNGIHTADDLTQADDAWIRKRMTIMGLKTVHELRGHKRFALQEDAPAKQTITVSRSFCSPISSHERLMQAVAAYVSRAARTLRADGSSAYGIMVFVRTGRYDDNYYAHSAHAYLGSPSAYTPTLIAAAQECLAAIYQAGYRYAKAGVVLYDLVGDDQCQLGLFPSAMADAEDYRQQKRLMYVYDQIIARYGSHVVHYAQAGRDQTWKAKRLHASARYTTTWHELLTVRT